MELDNMWCPISYGNDWAGYTASQSDCQDMCLKNPSCVGISYSYRAGMSNTCFVCTTVPMDGFRQNSFGFAFYRAPGKVFLLPNTEYAIQLLLYMSISNNLFLIFTVFL